MCVLVDVRRNVVLGDRRMRPKIIEVDEIDQEWSLTLTRTDVETLSLIHI